MGRISSECIISIQTKLYDVYILEEGQQIGVYGC